MPSPVGGPPLRVARRQRDALHFPPEANSPTICTITKAISVQCSFHFHFQFQQCATVFLFPLSRSLIQFPSDDSAEPVSLARTELPKSRLLTEAPLGEVKTVRSTPLSEGVLSYSGFSFPFSVLFVFYFFRSLVPPHAHLYRPIISGTFFALLVLPHWPPGRKEGESVENR